MGTGESEEWVVILEERRGERQETSVLTFPTTVQPLAMLLIYLLLPEILFPPEVSVAFKELVHQLVRSRILQLLSLNILLPITS